MNRSRSHGFTLIEVAIVLVVVALLLGGVLKGRELMTGARARSLIQQQDEIKVAYFGFLDRYGALPGDYPQASASIAGITPTPACNNGNGDGDGRIEAANNENRLVWEHLSRVGFLSSIYTCAAAPGPTTGPVNPYGHYLDIVHDADYAGTASARNNLKSGAQVPSDVLAEMDRKIDDGNALSGIFRAQVGGGVSATPADCYSVGGLWVTSPPGSNCGAVVIF